MNPLEIQLKALVKYLSEKKIKYSILGGIAVAIYGEPRLTVDIDVNIYLDKTKINKFLNRASKYGFYSAFPNIEDFIKKTGVIPMNFKKGKITGKFDFIIAENILEKAAINRSRMRKIDSVMVRLVSPEDLIIHKITSLRPRDREDLEGILIRQKGRLDINYIRKWLKRIDKIDKNLKLLKLFDDLLKSLKD